MDVNSVIAALVLEIWVGDNGRTQVPSGSQGLEKEAGDPRGESLGPSIFTLHTSRFGRHRHSPIIVA